MIETKKQQLVEARMWRKQQEEYEVSCCCNLLSRLWGLSKTDVILLRC